MASFLGNILNAPGQLLDYLYNMFEEEDDEQLRRTRSKSLGALSSEYDEFEFTGDDVLKSDLASQVKYTYQS